MSLEVRRVSKDWQHPTDKKGGYIPLYEGYAEAIADVKESIEKIGLEETIEEHEGYLPYKYDYMPDWPEEIKTYYQLYENVSEGTPISPPMESPEVLAQWLADNCGPHNDNYFLREKATYEEWLCVVKTGGCCSFTIIEGELHSGVKSCQILNKKI